LKNTLNGNEMREMLLLDHNVGVTPSVLGL